MRNVEQLIFSGAGQGTIPEQQAALASSLRNRDQMGLLMAMTGDPALSPVGQQMTQNVSAQRQQMINQEYYRKQAEAARIRLAEEERHNKAMENQGYARLRTMEKIGALKGQKPPSIPQTAITAAQNYQQQVRALRELRAAYKDEWTSKFPKSSSLRLALAQQAPMFADKETLEYRDWMARFKGWYENPVIHELYGSALTAPEVKRWASQAMAPDAPAATIRNFIQVLEKHVAPVAKAQMDLFRLRYGDKAADALEGNVPNPEADDIDAQIKMLLEEELAGGS